MAAKVKEAREYSMEETYAVGDKLFHSGFQDVGEVIEVGETQDKVKKMVVRFSKAKADDRPKRLIMGLPKKKTKD